MLWRESRIRSRPHRWTIAGLNRRESNTLYRLLVARTSERLASRAPTANVNFVQTSRMFHLVEDLRSEFVSHRGYSLFSPACTVTRLSFPLRCANRQLRRTRPGKVYRPAQLLYDNRR